MYPTHAGTLLAIAIVTLLSPSTVRAQSDPANFANVFDYPGTPPLSGTSLPGSTQLNVLTGGVLSPDDFPFFPSPFLTLTGNQELNVLGGQLSIDTSIGEGAVVNIISGAVLNGFQAFNGSTVIVSGGNIGEDFKALPGSLVFISGGTIGDRFEVTTGGALGEVNISGGTFGEDFTVQAGGEANIQGGTFGDGFTSEPDAEAELVGGEFLVNGSTVSSGVIGLGTDGRNVLTGTLRDGSVFIFSNHSDDLRKAVLTDIGVAAADLTPTVVDSSNNPFAGGLRPGQTLTLRDGGSVRGNYAAVGATLNVEGGMVSSDLEIAETELNISGGQIGLDAIAFIGSSVNVSGGQVGTGFVAYDGSTVNVSGGMFAGGFVLNPSIFHNQVPGRVRSRSGLHADGGVINVSGGVVGAGARATNTGTFNVQGGQIGQNFLVGKSGVLNVTGGQFGDHLLIKGEANLDGGTFGMETQLADGVLNISGGEFGTPFSPTSGSSQAALVIGSGPVLRCELGTGSTCTINTPLITILPGAGGTANISGGVFHAAGFNAPSVLINNASAPSESAEEPSPFAVTITGGDFDSQFTVRGTISIFNTDTGVHEVQPTVVAEVAISGGTFGADFNAEPGSNVELLGGDFKIGGVAFAGGRVDSVPSGLVTGVLQDGSPFIFTPEGPLDDRVQPIRLTEVALPAADLSPIVVDSLVGAPRGLRPGQQLTLLEGGRLERHFAVLDSQLTVNGGEIARGLEVAGGGQVNISGGRSFGEMQVHAGGTLNVTGGLVAGDNPTGSSLGGNTLIATSGGLVNISGGEIDGLFRFDGSELNISGGKLGNRNEIKNPDSIVNITGGEIERLDVEEADTMNISGGSISHLGLGTNASRATTYNISGGQVDSIGLNRSSSSNDRSRSTINFFGTEFLLDGEEIPGLTMGEVFTILDESAGIGIVPFGSELVATLADGTVFDFSTQMGSTGDPGAILNLILVESDSLPGDFNNDGTVDAADYTVWRDGLGATFTTADYEVWRSNFGATGATSSNVVPEPSTILLTLVAIGVSWRSLCPDWTL